MKAYFNKLPNVVKAAFFTVLFMSCFIGSAFGLSHIPDDITNQIRVINAAIGAWTNSHAYELNIIGIAGTIGTCIFLVSWACFAINDPKNRRMF